jgi:spoIIIJ-associated protein
MNESRTSLEVIAPSVEEAISKGLDDLGLTEDEVDVEILDPGTRGLFGLGSRQARIRLSVRQMQEPGEGDSVTSLVETVEVEEMYQPQPSKVEAAAPVKKQTVKKEITLDREALAVEVAQGVVQDLLEKMHVHATVTSRLGEVDEKYERTSVHVDINGNDLSILIGPRAETLEALQYITGLMVAKEIGYSVPIVVDVQGYRARREQQIRQLARRMADQAVKTGRRQVLEPMPASERRLIHIELRDHPSVMTESIGEEPRRKVTIVPKA